MEGCREWQGARTSAGYGHRWDRDQRKVVDIHRWVWEQINGPIPEGMVVMHTCDNPPCFLYDHLRLGTHAENMADMRAKGRSHKGEMHGNAKLTLIQVIEIRTAIAAGEVQTDLAERYGVTRATICDINRRRGWNFPEAFPSQ